MLVAAGLPAPATQVTVRCGGGGRFRVDFVWVEQRLCLEVDGFRYHGAPGRFVADRQRSNLLAAAGWEVLRTTAAEVRDDPAPLVAAIRCRIMRPEG